MSLLLRGTEVRPKAVCLVMLGIDSKTPCVVGRLSVTGLYTQPKDCFSKNVLHFGVLMKMMEEKGEIGGSTDLPTAKRGQDGIRYQGVDQTGGLHLLWSPVSN